MFFILGILILLVFIYTCKHFSFIFKFCPRFYQVVILFFSPLQILTNPANKHSRSNFLFIFLFFLWNILKMLSFVMFFILFFSPLQILINPVNKHFRSNFLFIFFIFPKIYAFILTFSSIFYFVYSSGCSSTISIPVILSK